MSEFEVRRSAVIAAPPAIVYARLIDFRRWSEWSPWEGVDPNLSREYSEPSGGVGASYAWSGNRKAGQGRMEITDAEAPERVALDLTFLKPFKANNRITFVLTPTPDGATAIDWIMNGRNDSLITRAFAKVVSMDKLVGGDFERGLAALKERSEAEAQTPA